MSENRIILETPLRGGSVTTEEGLASESITPGHVVEPGGSNDYQKHSTANGNKSGMFALKKEPNGGISDSISSGELVTVATPPQNTKVNVLLDSSSSDITEGDLVESNGDGTVTKLGDNTDAGDDDPIIGRATETVSSPGSGTVRLQIKTL